MPKYNITDIDVRPDGVYILINKNSNNIKSDIGKVIQKYQIKEVNFAAIEEAIKGAVDEFFISSNKDIFCRNETAEVALSSDKMKASIRFNPPIYIGKNLSKEDIMQVLVNNGIKIGINEELVEKLAQEKEYEKWYEIAEGILPEGSIDGYIEYFFETDKKSLKPKELEDGTVDYRNINFFDVFEQGKTLAVMHPHIQGADGMNVIGKSVPAARPKKSGILPKGKNTTVLEDGKTLIAEISGRLLYLDGRANILPVLEIPGNVDNSTGNINFIGTVVVKGNVLSGFEIIAGDSIEIEGSVEGATLRAKNNIVLMKGVQGGGNAVIEAGQDVIANFIEMSAVSAGRDITANSILHSTVKCDNVLTLTGKRGLLVGGKATVGKKISARTIGSHMSTLTEIEVGIFPNLLDRYKETVNIMESLNKNFEKYDKVVEVLSKQNPATLPDIKKQYLMDALRSKIVLKAEIKDTNILLESLMEKLQNTSGGMVEASDRVYNGVKVMINNAVMYVRDDLQFCILYNKEGKVCIGAHV